MKYAIMGGVAFLILGLGGLIGLRALMGPQDVDPPTVAGDQPNAADAAQLDNNSENASANDGDSNAEPDTAVVDTDIPPSHESTLPAMDAIAPEQILLANLKQVVLEVRPLPSDSRNVVGDAVRTGTEEALQKCQLKCVESGNSDDPRLVVKLSLSDDAGFTRLRLKSEMQGEMQGLPIEFWTHEAPVVVITEKAVESGIMPSGLQRELGTYFKPLRERIVNSRRVVKARMETKRLQKDDDSGFE